VWRRDTDLLESADSELGRKQELLYALRDEDPAHQNADQEKGLRNA
jgi:hypothetical protein